MIAGSLVRVSLAALMVLGGAALTAPAAIAQAWSWGGGNEVAGSGKEEVKFNASFKKGEVIVSFSDRRLYLITGPGQALSYPIAIPREQSRWQGVMTVTDKRVNPSWTPTPEMRRENPRLPSWVPGGHPMNPMGVRALYLGSSMYRIHGTDAPWTIGQPVSKGCIRMYNQDVVDLFDRVPVGTKITVTWQSFMGGSRSDGERVAEAKPEATKASQRRRPARTDEDGEAAAEVRPEPAKAQPQQQQQRRRVSQTTKAPADQVQEN
jgi:lipoprotein-anchoring transpeptidase ErfK/SrfK